MNAKRTHPMTTAALILLAALCCAACGGANTSSYAHIKRTLGDARDDLMGSRPTTAELFPEDATPLIDINYDAADTMMGRFPAALNDTSPIYYERFTNRVDMNDPAPFGGLVADHVASRLALRRFLVTEGPPPRNVQKHTPEPLSVPEALANSGDAARELAKREKAQASSARPCLLSGSYLIADKVVYVTARLTALDDGQVVAAHSWTVPVNRNTRALLPQLRQNGGLKPSVRTSLSTSPHKLANPKGQPQIYVERDLVR